MKIAVIFPGVGYHTDKPLLYYSKKLAKAYGYEIKEITYKDLPSGIKGDPMKMKQAFEIAFATVKEDLSNIDFSEYDDILFISKSIGTAVAAMYAKTCGHKVRNIFFTPVDLSYSCMDAENCKDGKVVLDGIVLHGLSDPWCDKEITFKECKRLGFPYYSYEGANHSIETESPLTDIENLEAIMKIVDEFI